MRLLVTGGAGFIGSNFIRYWLTRHPSDWVTNLDALTYAGDVRSLAEIERASGDRYRFVQGDIGDLGLVEEVLTRDRIEIIVHFAAESHNSRAVLDPGLFIRTTDPYRTWEAAVTQDLRRGPTGPRPPLPARPLEDHPRTGMAAANPIRGWTARYRGVVPGALRLVGAPEGRGA